MSFADVDGHRLTRCALHVPQRGAWHAVCDFEAAPELGARVVLRVGKLQLRGSVVPEYAGVHAEQRLAVIVGGGGGWGAEIGPRAYHNDALVKARLVAEDVAREVGETIGVFAPASERVGAYFIRDAARAASRVLEDVIGDTLWWVDFDGLTHVGARPTAAGVAESDYQVLNYDPRERIATLRLSDPSVLSIGAVLVSPAVSEPITVRAYTVQTDATGVRVTVWCGGGDRSGGRLAELWRRLATRVTDDPLFGLYRYRVVRMAADGRVSLQSVRRSAGLPDIEPVSQWPGVAGVHAELTPGAEVLVAFVEGDRAAPIVTHYAGKDGTGFVPVTLTLGGSAGEAAARQNDAVEVLLPPAVFSGTMSGAPVTGVITFPLMTTLGKITTGSSKVKVAT